jgi:hypothetical protein
MVSSRIADKKLAATSDNETASRCSKGRIVRNSGWSDEKRWLTALSAIAL